MALNTRTKITIAKYLSWTIRSARSAVGLPSSEVQCQRGGLRWELDLTEGIDLSIFALGSFEPATAKAFDRLVRPNMTVLDIGANIGAHALPLAKRVGSLGRVVAVEPTTYAFQKFTRNAELNPELSAQLRLVRAMVVAHRDLPDAIYARWPLVACAERHAVHGGSLCDCSGALRITLDHLVERECNDRVDVIKIDVDGHEFDVLECGTKTLQKIRPIILIELCEYIHCDEGRGLNELLAIFSKYEYVFANINFHPLTSNVMQLRAQIPKAGGINALAIPRERWPLSI